MNTVPMQKFFSSPGNFILVILFICHLFLRIYNFETLNPFGWDQIDNVWAVKDIVIDHKYPLVGMVAKGNSGFYIGPLYYYFIAPFYWIFQFDPIASGVIAGITSIFSFFILYFVTKRLFTQSIALIALFIHTFSIYVIGFDRIQWPVNFIAPFSLLLLYSLYNLLQGSRKHFLIFSFVLGLSFHIHFTSVLFPLLLLLSLPFINWSKKLLYTIPFAISIVFMFLLPNILYEMYSGGSSSKNMSDYLTDYYHGFHVRRFIQVANDAFIEFDGIIHINFFKETLKFIVFPLFILSIFINKKLKGNYKLFYLFFIWFLVPWIVFSVYKGEISNYYFSLTRMQAIIMLAYVLHYFFTLKSRIIPWVLLSIGIVYVVFNLKDFNYYDKAGVTYFRNKVVEKINRGEQIPFVQGDPESYLYYYYTVIRQDSN